MVIRTHSEEETVAAGKNLGQTLTPGSVIAMYGGLGAGKTAFVRGLAQALDAQCRVSSPTFTIVNEYPGKLPLFHFDMYRLQSSDELFDIGWEDYLSRGGVCAVEWSENVPDAFEPGTITVSIERVSDSERVITIGRLEA